MNIIVTGSSKGIGPEVVKAFCKHKGNQIVAISRNTEGLRKLSAECQKINPSAKVTAIEFDLSQFEFYPFILQKIENSFHRCGDLLGGFVAYAVNFGKFCNRCP